MIVRSFSRAIGAATRCSSPRPWLTARRSWHVIAAASFSAGTTYGAKSPRPSDYLKALALMIVIGGIVAVITKWVFDGTEKRLRPAVQHNRLTSE